MVLLQLSTAAAMKRKAAVCYCGMALYFTTPSVTQNPAGCANASLSLHTHNMQVSSCQPEQATGAPCSCASLC
jgi:hypothetical protein